MPKIGQGAFSVTARRSEREHETREAQGTLEAVAHLIGGWPGRRRRPVDLEEITGALYEQERLAGLLAVQVKKRIAELCC